MPSLRPRRSVLDRAVAVTALLSSLLVEPVVGALIGFDNCLDRTVINSRPQQLQFVPLFVDAKFNTTDGVNRLNITVFGNVTGQLYTTDLPPAGSDDWSNPDQIDGKIIDLNPKTNILTTLFADVRALDYSAWRPPAGYRFCEYAVNKACPLIPAFNANASDPTQLPGFTVAHNFYSTYSMTTLTARLSVQSGQDARQTAPFLACVMARVTPVLTSTLSAVLTFVPIVIVLIVAIATVLAAWLSPWSSPDLYRWSINYNRDVDIVRLVTPGFGDCLHYMQFAVLSGSLSLRYPGFFQPVLSKSAWSVLMFDQSLASGRIGAINAMDDIYIVNAARGLSGMRQYVGMAEDQDVWTGMIVWLCAAIGLVAIASQLLVAARWFQLYVRQSANSDRQNKSIPFMIGNLVRVVFNFFFLPFVSLTMFQFVVSSRSSVVITVMAVLCFLITGAAAVWIMRVIFTTRPRAQLVEFIPTVLKYGPLYNNYRDPVLTFAAVPILITVLRGIAIGALQPSGIAQLVILAITEVVFLMALHAWSPYISEASMHAHHTVMSAVRIIVIMMSIAFVPVLEVSESVKGWIGYSILLLHALVLVFWYFLNSLQTLLEVFARLGGAGSARGGLSIVLGGRELSKRRHRGSHQPRGSDSAMLPQKQETSDHGRTFSNISGAMLRPAVSNKNGDKTSQAGETHSPGGSTPGGSQSPFPLFSPQTSKSVGHTYAASVGTNSSQRASRPSYIEPSDPYYRPPRQNRLTADSEHTGRESYGSRSGETSQPRLKDEGAAEGMLADQGDMGMPTAVRREVSTLKYLGKPGDRQPRDYAVRESDYYYGNPRGPALSSTPTRKLKTGPADPTGPVSNAAGWFKGVLAAVNLPGFGTKEKGFQVVRSKPAAEMMKLEDDEAATTAAAGGRRYQDEGELPPPRLGSVPASRAMSNRSSRPPSDVGRLPSFSGFDPRGSAFLDEDTDLSYRPPTIVPAAFGEPFTDSEPTSGTSARARNESGMMGYVFPPPGPTPGQQVPPTPSAGSRAKETAPPSSFPSVPRRSSKRQKSADQPIPLISLSPNDSSRRRPSIQVQSPTPAPESQLRRSRGSSGGFNSGRLSAFSTFSASHTPTSSVGTIRNEYEGEHRIVNRPSAARDPPPVPPMNSRRPSASLPTAQALMAASSPDRRERDGGDSYRESSRLPFVNGSLTDRSYTPLSRTESFYSLPDPDDESVGGASSDGGGPGGGVRLTALSPSGSIANSPEQSRRGVFGGASSSAAAAPPPSAWPGRRYVFPSAGSSYAASSSRTVSTGTVSSHVAGHSVAQITDALGPAEARNSVGQTAEYLGDEHGGYESAGAGRRR